MLLHDFEPTKRMEGKFIVFHILLTCNLVILSKKLQGVQMSLSEPLPSEENSESNEMSENKMEPWPCDFL